MKVAYKAQRAGNNAGDEITDPKDFFEEVFHGSPAEYKVFYDNLPGEKQQEFLAIFDGLNVWAAGTGASWLAL